MTKDQLSFARSKVATKNVDVVLAGGSYSISGALEEVTDTLVVVRSAIGRMQVATIESIIAIMDGS
jgi:hypothetical protein